MTVSRFAAVCCAVLIIAGCSSGNHDSQPIPTADQTLALFRADVIAAQHHDQAALCGTAEFSDQCNAEIRSNGWPALSDVRSAGVRVVDIARVVHVCGDANGQPFEGDFPVQHDSDGLHAVNAVFWIPIDFVPNPGEGAAIKASASPGQSAPPPSC